MSAPSDLVGGRIAGPVTGEDNDQEALAKALANSGLTAVRQADGSFVLRRAEDGPRADAGDAVSAEDAANIIDIVDPSGDGDSGFKAGDAGDVARIANAPLAEIPLSVGVVTEDAIASQSLTDSKDALRSIAGVTVTDGGVNVRGFGNDHAIKINGMSGGQALPPPDLVGRVEVLKGATSIFTGICGDGGVVNLKIKSANGERTRQAKTEIGTDGDKALSFDVGDAFSNFDQISWRVAGEGCLGRFREDAAKPQTVSIAPSPLSAAAPFFPFSTGVRQGCRSGLPKLGTRKRSPGSGEVC